MFIPRQISVTPRLAAYVVNQATGPYRRLHVLLLREGWEISHKRMYRLYSEEGLSIGSRTPRRRRACRYRSDQAEAGGAKDVWAMDFMSNRLFD